MIRRIIIILMILLGCKITPVSQAAPSATNVVNIISNGLTRLAGLTNLEITSKSIIAYAPGITGTSNWGNTVSTTTYTYAGSRFRMSYSVQSSYLNSDSVTNWQTAYDGNKYRWYRGDIGQMIYSHGENLSEPFTMPNPLVANFLFLSRESDDCRGCYPTISELLRLPMGSAAIFTNILEIKESSIDFISGKTEDHPAYWSLDWNNAITPSGSFEPHHIDRHIKDEGTVEFFLTYTNLNALGASLSIPSGYTVQVKDTDGNVAITGRVEIIDIRFNPQKEDQFFSMADLDPRSIFDGDNQHLDKSAPHGSLDPAQLKQRLFIRRIFFAIISLTSCVFAISLFYKKRSSISLFLICCCPIFLDGCSKEQNPSANSTTPLTDLGFGPIRFGMDEAELNRVFPPDFRTGNVLGYKTPKIALILSKKDHVVTELLYGSMDLANSAAIDTNVYNLRFNGMIGIGDPAEKISSSLGDPTRHDTTVGAVIWIYDHQTNVDSFYFSSNRLVLLSIKVKKNPNP